METEENYDVPYEWLATDHREPLGGCWSRTQAEASRHFHRYHCETSTAEVPSSMTGSSWPQIIR